MTLNLISLATVKTQLGLSGSDYEAELTALIPIVSSDLRRILNIGFDKYISATFSSASASINLGYNSFELGQVVYHSNIPADTYLQSYNPITGLYTLSATPTGTGDYVYLGVKISQWPTIAKMLWYKYQKQNVNSALDKKTSSESFGPVSVSYTQNEINAQYDYPSKLIDDLGSPCVRVG